MNLKIFLLKNRFIREILFFVFHKKVYKRILDKRIDNYIYENKNVRKEDFIVSLTSFPSRINEVQYTIYSLLLQSVIPKKIYLWLAEEQFHNKNKDLPDRLLKLQNEIFEIKWCKDLRSYKKLLPNIQNNVQENIIICDDDIFYRKKTLEILWTAHLKNKDSVICHIGKQFTFDKNNKIIPYVNWRWVKYCSNRRNVLPIGGGCVFYPKSVLYNSKFIINEELCMKLAKYADDIWFWFSITNAGYKICIPKKSIKKMIFTNPEREYGITDGFTLTKVNEGENLNDSQIKNIVEYFKIDLFDYIREEV